MLLFPLALSDRYNKKSLSTSNAHSRTCVTLQRKSSKCYVLSQDSYLESSILKLNLYVYSASDTD